MKKLTPAQENMVADLAYHALARTNSNLEEKGIGRKLKVVLLDDKKVLEGILSAIPVR